jgi:outer membrane protein OmpA-like peptidoglycan-associated protein
MNIKKRLRHLLLGAATAVLLVGTPAFAQDTGHIKGLITAVEGNTITIKDSNNVTQTITLTPETTVKSVSGLVGGQRPTVEQSALIPGLPISADVVPSGSGFTATQINFKEKDLKTAQQIHAGMHGTKEQVEANKNRMNDFGTKETLASIDVTFASGSASISAKGKADLLAFAEKAKATKGYIVSTTGYTDSTGSAAKNLALSKARASAVHDFLQRQGGLLPARVIASDGMGVATDAGSGSNASARKVTVNLIQDKGLAGGN